MRLHLSYGQQHRLAAAAGTILVVLVLSWLLWFKPTPLWITKIPLAVLWLMALVDGLWRVALWERHHSTERPQIAEVALWVVKMIGLGIVSLVAAGLLNGNDSDPTGSEISSSLLALLAYTIAVTAVAKFPKGQPIPGLYYNSNSQERLSIAAHEAGHALVYALLVDGLPVDFEAHALPLPAEEIGGVVRGDVRTYGHHRQGVRWMMLLKVGGIAGERAIGNTDVTGTEWDLIGWDRQARSYNIMYGSSRLSYKSADLQETVLRATELQTLLEENIADVLEFIEANRAIFDDLRNELARGRVIRVREAVQRMADVRFTDKCVPVRLNYPYGSIKWPDEALRRRKELYQQ